MDTPISPQTKRNYYGPRQIGKKRVLRSWIRHTISRLCFFWLRCLCCFPSCAPHDVSFLLAIIICPILFFSKFHPPLPRPRRTSSYDESSSLPLFVHYYSHWMPGLAPRPQTDLKRHHEKTNTQDRTAPCFIVNPPQKSAWGMLDLPSGRLAIIVLHVVYARAGRWPFVGQKASTRRRSKTARPGPSSTQLRADHTLLISFTAPHTT